MDQLQRTKIQAQKNGQNGSWGDKCRITTMQVLLFTNNVLREPFLQTSFQGTMPTGSKKLTSIANLSIQNFKNYLLEPLLAFMKDFQKSWPAKPTPGRVREYALLTSFGHPQVSHHCVASCVGISLVRPSQSLTDHCF